MSKEKTSISISPKVMEEVRAWAERTGESVSAFFELAATERTERLRQAAPDGKAVFEEGNEAAE
jgi:hypothetical protein